MELRASRGQEFKKTVYCYDQTRPDIARRRERWRKHQGRIDVGYLVFIDETWTKTNMAPSGGWGNTRQAADRTCAARHWKTTTFLAALRSDAITAPCVFDGPINGESFLLYVQQILVPTLRFGDLLVMDKLGSHKAQAIRHAIWAADAKLIVLPPNSPVLNPMEQAFSKLKHHLRNAKERTVEATWQRIGSILTTFTATEIRNFFPNAGYGSV